MFELSKRFASVETVGSSQKLFRFRLALLNSNHSDFKSPYLHPTQSERQASEYEKLRFYIEQFIKWQKSESQPVMQGTLTERLRCVSEARKARDSN